MGAINWQQFGLKTDPYDTSPLIEGGELPLEKAFVGREREKEFLENVFASEKRLSLAICGDVGVGKTSLANYQKYVWKYRRPKLLFSFRREIEACEEMLTKRAFLREIIGSVIREIRLLQPELLEEKELEPLRRLTEITRQSSLGGGLSMEVGGYGGGVEFQKGETGSQPPVVSMSLLEEYFLLLVDFIKKTKIRDRRYSGLIVHVNNLDVLLSEKERNPEVIRFFNEIRDVLQTPDVYFLFLGPTNLFRDIIASQKRVKSIFYQTPLQIKPLSKTEIILTLNERMKLLKSDDVTQYIKPIEDEVIYALYDLYEGDIRSIMSAIRDILGQRSERLGRTVGRQEAQGLLARERWDRIKNAIKLTPEQTKVVKYFAESDGSLTQKEVSEAFSIAQPNVSGYYFKPLREAGIIEEKEGSSKPTRWELTWEYLPLRWTMQAEETENTGQSSLF